MPLRSATPDDARILHYLGALAAHTPSTCLQISSDIRPFNDAHILHDNLYAMDVQNICHIASTSAGAAAGYLLPFAEWLEAAAAEPTSPVRFMLGDQTSVPQTARAGTVMKARRVEHVERPVLLPFDYGRHWGNVPAALANSAPLAARRDVCIWRGATTGYADYEAGSRVRLVKRWGTARAMRIGIDAGFSMNVQGKSEALRKSLTVDEQMAYRYIVSARGNDKDSGLNWKLASGSVVLMTKPHIESWLMESTLVDGVHYVRVKDDWSDLGAKVAWCRRNPAACEAIAASARAFMHQFGSPSDEARLAVDVLKGYFARTM